MYCKPTRSPAQLALTSNLLEPMAACRGDAVQQDRSGHGNCDRGEIRDANQKDPSNEESGILLRPAVDRGQRKYKAA